MTRTCVQLCSYHEFNSHLSGYMKFIHVSPSHVQAVTNESLQDSEMPRSRPLRVKQRVLLSKGETREPHWNREGIGTVSVCVSCTLYRDTQCSLLVCGNKSQLLWLQRGKSTFALVCDIGKGGGQFAVNIACMETGLWFQLGHVHVQDQYCTCVLVTKHLLYY